MSDQPICGRCRLPIHRDSPMQYFGTFVTHEPNECVRLLHSENERLRADKDRLDWLDGTALSVDLAADPDGLVQVWYNTDPPMVSAAKGVRAAIDAAMKQEGERCR